MNTQDKDKALEHYLAGDSEISSLYHEADAGQPPAELDATILAAASKATGSRPRRSTSPFSGNNWIMPSSLAAVLVITVGLVHLLENQSAQLTSAFEAPVSDSSADISESLAAIAPTEQERLADAIVSAPAPARALAPTAPATAPPLEKLMAEKTMDAKPIAVKPIAVKPMAREKPKLSISAEAKQATIEEQRRNRMAQATSSADHPRKSIEKQERFALQKKKADVSTGRLALRSESPALLAEQDTDAGLVGSIDTSNLAPTDSISAISQDVTDRRAEFELKPAEWLRQIAALRERGDVQAAGQSLDDFIAFHFPDKEILGKTANGFVTRADELPFDDSIARQFTDELTAQGRMSESLKYRAQLGLGSKTKARSESPAAGQ